MLKTTYKHLTLAAICMAMLSSCSSDDAATVVDTQGEKTPIEFTAATMGNSVGMSAQTRSVVSTDRYYGQDAKAFSSETALSMILKSEDGSKAKYARTLGKAAAGSGAESKVTFEISSTRYWEDTYSRSAKLSAFAVCVPGKTGALKINDNDNYSANTWTSDVPTMTIVWPLGTATTAATQGETFVADQDLCFSNNVSNLESTENRLKFDDATKKFTSGKLIFHHALTRITFKIKKGTGFTDTDDFSFSNSGENIVLKGFNTAGTFNIAEGAFNSSTITSTTNITSLYNKGADDTYAHVLEGILLPGTDLSATNVGDVSFTIGHNKYELTKEQLMNATLADGTTKLSAATLTDGTTLALDGGKVMRPGVNYVFILTLSKTKVENLSAAVVPWEEVTANQELTNARITVNLMDGTGGTGNFDLYRKTSTSSTIDDNFADYDWKNPYPTDTKLTLALNQTHNTSWLWPDNKTFYHFRSIMPSGSEVKTDATGDGDYVELTAGDELRDVCWGAPFISTTGKLTYSETTGFDNETSGSHQISKAIGATKSNISLKMFHAMSDVTINLETTDGDDKVDLSSVTLSLSNIYDSGKILLGNGRVMQTGNPATQEKTTTDKTWHRYFVPQPLSTVVLTILTKDNDKYEVNMSDVVAATSTNSVLANTPKDAKITSWLPNYKYTYTFTLRKAKMEVKVTLADWEKVTANSEVWF